MGHTPIIVLVPLSVQNIEEEVERILAPYSLDIEVEPYKVYFEKDEIEHMARVYKIESLEELVQYIEDWSGYSSGGIDEEGLYGVTTENPEGSWDYWQIGGRWDGCLKGENVLPLADLLTLSKQDLKIIPFAVIEPNGEWHSTEATVSPEMLLSPETNNEQIRDADYREFIAVTQELFQKHQDCLAVFCDLHA
jgi:hypothetical protein